MATPFADPRTGQLYFRRAVPEPLPAAFDGKAVHKVSLRTKDPAEAKEGFARENATFEARLAEARRRIAEGTLLPTPAALVRRWCEGPAVGKGLSGAQRLIATFMELDTAAGRRWSSDAEADIYPPPLLGPAANTDWSAVFADKEQFEALLTGSYGGDVERAGTNWIRSRWHQPEQASPDLVDDPAARCRMAW